MKSNKTRAVDIRTIRTKKAIANAVSDAMLVMGKDRITVKVVAERAKISRKTFYFYYKSVDEVLETIQKSFISQLCDLLDSINEVDDSIPAKLFTKLNEVFEGKEDFYLKLCNFKDVDFEDNLITMIKEHIVEGAKANGVDLGDLPFAIDYALSGMLYCYSSWLKSGKQKSIEEMSNLLGSLTMNGVNSIK